jgi:hypothetical protein
MEYSTFAAGALIYAAGALHAWTVIAAPAALKLQRIVLIPGAMFLVTVAVGLLAPPFRHALKTHLWISFRTGFGQSVISVLAVVLVLAFFAGFIYFDTAQAAHGGQFPASAFSAYATGVGVLLAQAILVRRLESDPVLGPRIAETTGR